MFSLFNSENDPDPVQTKMNFFTPRFVNMTAGEPLTFHVAAYGTTAARNIAVAVSSKGGLDSVEVDTTSNNNPSGSISYITVMHSTTGQYNLILNIGTTVSRTILVQVNPAPFYSIKVVSDPTLVANGKKVPTGTLVSYNFTLIDRYGNNIYTYESKRPSAQRI